MTRRKTPFIAQLRAALVSGLMIGGVLSAPAALADTNQQYKAPAAVKLVSEPYADAALVGLLKGGEYICLRKQEQRWCYVTGRISGWLSCDQMVRVIPGRPC